MKKIKRIATMVITLQFIINASHRVRRQVEKELA